MYDGGSNTFSRSQRSHIKLITKHVKNIDKLTNSDISNLFHNLRTSKDKQPSDNYLISILRTIKKCNPSITKKPHQLNLQSERVSQESDVSIATKKIVTYLVKETYDLSQVIIDGTDHRSLIDAYIAILMITSTSITINDLYTMTIDEYNNLVRHKKIQKEKRVLCNVMFELAEPVIASLLTRRGEIDTSTRYNIERVISCSHNILNRAIKKLCEETAVFYKVDVKVLHSLGLKKFRFTNPNLLYNMISK